MTFVGVLTDTSGVPLSAATESIQVMLWDSATGGTQVCSTPSSPVPLTAGAFQVVLPDACITAVHANPNVWAELFVNGTSLGQRLKLGAVPYAVEAGHATAADNATNATSATTAQAAASATAATAMTSGSIRLENSNCTAAAGTAVDCICRANEVAISGGAYSGMLGNSLNASQFGPSYGGSTQTWRISCVDPSGNRAQCAQPFAICLAVK
jgi:hypothetical protein